MVQRKPTRRQLSRDPLQLLLHFLLCLAEHCEIVDVHQMRPAGQRRDCTSICHPLRRRETGGHNTSLVHGLTPPHGPRPSHWKGPKADLNPRLGSHGLAVDLLDVERAGANRS